MSIKRCEYCGSADCMCDYKVFKYIREKLKTGDPEKIISWVDEKSRVENKDTRMANISMVLCMIAAIYIAVIPETVFSATAWIVYIAGAITGIIHLRRVGDKPTARMYFVWLVLDIIAVTRLVLLIF